MLKFKITSMCFLAMLGIMAIHSPTVTAKTPIPTAILPFDAKGNQDQKASQVADLLFVNLLASDRIMLVERQAVDRVFAELKLSQSGVVQPGQATQVGKLTGAKLLITGSVLQVDGDLYVVAKVIGTETSQLSGASVKGAINDDLGELVKRLAVELNEVIAKSALNLLPQEVAADRWLADAKQTLKGKKLPTVTVAVTEQHVGQRTFDPAAQTEIERLLTELGFPVVASANANAVRADVLIKGEAISQYATSHSDLVSVKCRVELQVTLQADGRVLTSDAETTIGIDLAEQIAAKAGLQEAARKLVERLLSKVAT